jgi:major type 1 subunit fimbrin (pilin)
MGLVLKAKLFRYQYGQRGNGHPPAVAMHRIKQLTQRRFFYSGIVNMKKILLLSALVTVSSFTTLSHASDGSINVTGTISDATCTINAGSVNIPVAFGTVSSTAFTGVNSTAGIEPINIEFDSCPASITSAAVSFDGTSDAVNSDLFALTSSGAATGVAVGLYESDSATLIPFGSTSKTMPLSPTGGTLSYFAKYVQTATPVAAGTADTVINFTVKY